jgi:[FeFe] hydrogenase H-cluster maturation GTPase HydF
MADVAQDMQTPRAERIHIGLFGRCNSGKSALLNAITGQNVAIVSEVAGTTTDPGSKSMELPDLGAVVLVDTAGLDDATMLGQERMSRTLTAMDSVDIALLLFAGEDTTLEEDILQRMKHREIKVVPIISKSDLLSDVEPFAERLSRLTGEQPLCVSAKTGEGIDELRKRIASVVERDQRLLTYGLCETGDTVMLVMPQDKQAPVGRIIKPQVQTLRELLDRGCNAVCCTLESMPSALKSLAQPPQLIITDSQVFGKVSKIVPKDIPLTSFSILFARYKGNLWGAVNGAFKLDSLQDGDKILVSEGCTHHRQCGDIGTVKLPKWISEYTSKKLEFEFTSGRDFPEDVSDYALIIHCGGCMLTEREMQYRIRQSEDASVPITNYGMVIAHTHGILRRSLEPFVEK